MHPIFYHFSSTVVMYLSAAILADTQKKDPKCTLYLFCLLDTFSTRHVPSKHSISAAIISDIE